ncbi:MAG: right-handed parallel beta-helix repeat-containing protein [Myxococcota bacterium]|nr:right-handed parallel beta-helix repeat-containing protein [Myxococcota bacterium]
MHPRQGGGLHFSYADTGSILKEVEVSGNSAEDGAGLDIWWSTTNMTSLTITNNTASDAGGGVRLWETTSSITSTTISNNTATSDNGGGMSVQYGSSVTINTSTISNNTAGNRGAGISLRGKNGDNLTLSMTDSTISNNTATYDGGGLNIGSYSDVTLATCSITDNSADSGGGLYLEGGQVNEDYDYTSTLSVTDVSWGNATDDNDNSAQELTVQNNSYASFDWHDLDADESFTCDTSADPVCTFEE